MKNKVWIVLLSLPALFLSGCISGGGGGFDTVAFVRNPFIMALIVIVALWYAFKISKK